MLKLRLKKLSGARTYSKVRMTRSPLGSGFLSMLILQSIIDMMPSPNYREGKGQSPWSTTPARQKPSRGWLPGRVYQVLRNAVIEWRYIPWWHAHIPRHPDENHHHRLTDYANHPVAGPTSYKRYITGSAGGTGPSPRLGHQCSPRPPCKLAMGISSISERFISSSGENFACEDVAFSPGFRRQGNAALYLSVESCSKPDLVLSDVLGDLIKG
jgi:hypothetical protein